MKVRDKPTSALMVVWITVDVRSPMNAGDKEVIRKSPFYSRLDIYELDSEDQPYTTVRDLALCKRLFKIALFPLIMLGTSMSKMGTS